MTEFSTAPVGATHRPAQQQAKQEAQPQLENKLEVDESHQVKVRIPEVFIYYQMTDPDVVN